MLQDQAEPRPYADVEHAILRELGLPIGALFAEFEPEARAAASLAQARTSSVTCYCNLGVSILPLERVWKCMRAQTWCLLQHVQGRCIFLHHAGGTALRHHA